MNGMISLYGCGGAGITISHMFEKYTSNDILPGFGYIQPFYIDTSLANLNNLENGYTQDNAYVFEKIDGSGKIRKENAEQIQKHTLDILVKHKPGDLNIVVSSGSGGSGSVIAPSIASELLKQGHNVIVVCIGSTDSIIEIINTVNTLKSYESIANTRAKPVVMMFEQNVRGVKLDEINRKIYDKVVLLSALFSKQNTGLDSADLKNWLNYTKYTAVAPQLMTLGFLSGYINLEETGGDPISVATLIKKGQDSSPGITVDYRCYGVVPEEASAISINESLHYVVLNGTLKHIYDNFAEIKNELVRRQESRPTNKSIVEDSDRVESNGLIL